MSYTDWKEKAKEFKSINVRGIQGCGAGILY